MDQREPLAWYEFLNFTSCTLVFTNTILCAGDWQQTTLNFDAVAWRASWSLSGNVLAVSTGDNKVTLWKEKLTGGWECIKTIEE